MMHNYYAIHVISTNDKVSLEYVFQHMFNRIRKKFFNNSDVI